MIFQWMVKALGEVEHISDALRKQTVVLEETTGEFPQSIVVDFLNDRVDLLSNESVSLWDIIEVSVNHRAVQSKNNAGQRFNSINWRKVTVIARSNTKKTEAVKTPAE